jgi:uncharacterized ion transporter superfamily protein YfcC
MNRKEIADIITLSGIGGLEKEIKNKIRKNDIVWALCFCLVLTIYIGIYCKQVQKDKANIHQFKYDYASKVGKQYGIAMDSLVKISQNNGIENCIVK